MSTYNSKYTGLTVDYGLTHYVTFSGSAGVWTATIGNGESNQGTTSDFSLVAGIKLVGKISIEGGSSGTTLNLNGTGAKSIYLRDNVPLTTQLPTGSAIELIYNGTYWYVAGNTPAATKSNSHSHTASASGTAVTLNSHTHTATDSGHTHSYTKATGGAFTGTLGTTGTKTTGISAGLSEAPTFTGSSVTTSASGTGSGNITYSSTATGESASSVITNTTSAVTSISYDATAKSLNFTFGDVLTSVTLAKHTHTYQKTTDVTGPSHTHTVTAAGTIDKPDITITDNGHTHSFTPSGSVSLTSESATTGSTKATVSVSSTTVTTSSVTNPTIAVNSVTHTHDID